MKILTFFFALLSSILMILCIIEDVTDEYPYSDKFSVIRLYSYLILTVGFWTLFYYLCQN